MKTIKIKASGKYSVIVGNDLLKDLPKYLKKLSLNGKILIITDKNVNGIYAENLQEILTLAGFSCQIFVVKGGESSKSGKVYLEILEYLASNHYNRKDIVVALGGGVVGDLAGFVSATYLRGINFVQVPTTLLAFADSSVGGKTAINLSCGKNLAGAFYQPKLVLCDVSLANTLNEKERACGMAEIIKYGMVFDKNLIELLNNGMEDNAEEIIARCVELKKSVVEKDELDNGVRGLLNFGHTLGHAIEKNSDYKIPHGIAVGIGMQIITDICVKKGLIDKGVSIALKNLLVKYKIATSTEIPLEQLVETSLIDKKIKGKEITVVLPTKLGKCQLKKMSLEEWKKFILE